jgi:GNAT superfamily N-acetyltransferase
LKELLLGKIDELSLGELSLELSPATELDVEQLVLLRIAAMRESLERIGRFDPARARERFLSGFLPQYTRHIVAHGERVGFVVVKPAAEGLLLDHLYLHPTRQKLGIGGWVLRHVFAEADMQGLAIRVGALRGSDSNGFYTRHGFELVEVSDWDNYYLRKAEIGL